MRSVPVKAMCLAALSVLCLAASPGWPVTAREYWVSPRGNDANAGIERKPFATLERARDVVRALRKTHPQTAVRVTLRGGTYYLKHTLEFGPQDSGAKQAPVIYAAAKGEQVILSGGRRLSPTAFAPVTDPAILSRLPEESRDKVLQVDLRAQGVADFGIMRPHGWSRPYTNAPLELFINDQPTQLARWPNHETVRIGEVLDPGSLPGSGDYGGRGGTFTYGYDRPARWTQADDIWLSGYFGTGYADDTMKVNTIDLAKRTFTLKQAHRYGVHTGASFHTYYALNLLEEIDEPGEWYLDRKTGSLYLWPPSDLKKAKIAVSLLEGPMVAMEGTSYITLRGITFENARGMGVYIERGNDNLLAGCTFRNLGTVAVCMGQGIKTDPTGLASHPLQHRADQGEMVKGEPVSRELRDYHDGIYADTTWNRRAGTHHGVVSCDIYNTGAGGIVLGGGDRKTLTPGGNYVLNCHIHHYNRWEQGYRSAVLIDGVGNRIAHCLIHDAPQTAIELHGNDHVIEFNEIHDTCLEAADMGVFYMGREPSEQGNVLRYNFIHHAGSPYDAVAIYFDGACGETVLGNVIYKFRGAGTRCNGYDLTFRNNLFIDTDAGIHGWGNKEWDEYFLKAFGPLLELRLRKQIDVRKPPYSIRYPELAHILEPDPGYQRHSVVHDNLSIRSGEFGAANNHLQDNWVTDADPGFVDAAHMNFQLKPDSPVWTKMPGFKRIPFEKIGLYRDEYRKTLLRGGASG